MAYTDATATDLKTAFAKFAAVDDSTIDFWLERARRQVDQSWTEGDYAFGQMLLAAHYLTLEGLGTGTEAELSAQGIGDFKSVKSGSFSFTRSDGSGGEMSGAFGSTSYGRRWLELASANYNGAMITPSGTIPDHQLYQSGD